jgi:serpin B
MNTLLILFGLIFMSCEQEDNNSEFPIEEKEMVLSMNTKNMVTSDNQFGIEIFKQMLNAEQGNNLMISPLSISQALLMTYNGADGDTKKAFDETLFLNDLTIDDVNQSAQELVKALLEADPGVIIDIANSIWYRDEFTIKPEFIKANEDYYNAEVQQLVFNNEAVDIINDWVKNKTNDKIEEIIDQIDPMTLMFLIDAVYFKGNWKSKFKEEDTEDDEFTLANGSKVTVPFMYQSTTAKKLNNDDFTILDLPYGRGNFSMLIVLPNEGKTIDDVLEGWSNNIYNEWINNLYEVDNLDVIIPKFKFAYEKELNEVLKAMGLAIAFDTDQADFSNIIENTQLCVSDVKHKTFIEVNEKGTEAAAVTSVEVRFTSIGPSNQFIADRPFLFLIREKYTNSILFMGRVEDPSKE